MLTKLKMNCSLEDALDVTQLLYPRFEIRDGAILAIDLIGEDSPSIATFPSLTAAEILLNHVHILDCFENAAVSDSEPFYNVHHPDFTRACALGTLVARCWATKLQVDYPKRTFRVFYTQQDNPIVRFHQLRLGEPQYLDEVAWYDEVQDGRVVIYNVPTIGSQGTAAGGQTVCELSTV